MKTIEIKNKEYEIIKDYKNAIDKDAIESLLTEYFDIYDYIVGDWAYGKLRLKGFNDKNNKKINKLNNIENVDSYIKDYCAYECRNFILKKITNLDK